MKSMKNNRKNVETCDPVQQRGGRPDVGSKRLSHISGLVCGGCCAARIAHTWLCDIESLVWPAENAPQVPPQPILSLSLVDRALTIG